MNIVVLTGRLTQDPKLTSTQSGTAICTFCIAVRRTKEKTDFINCKAWKDTANKIAEYFRKGTAIGVVGSYYVDKYEKKDGEKRDWHYVNVNSFDFIEGKRE